MGLRSQAESDLSFILEDATFGFGYSISITDPDGTVLPDPNDIDAPPLIGFSGDVVLLVDPDTGQGATDRTAHATIRISTLAAAGLGIPTAVESGSKKPWLVRFNDIGGVAHEFKVKKSNPDRTLGMVTVVLERWKT